MKKDDFYNEVAELAVNSRLPIADLIGVLELLKLDLFISANRAATENADRILKESLPPGEIPGA